MGGALGSIGTIAGGIFGGPGGAAIGGSIGGILGGLGGAQEDRTTIGRTLPGAGSLEQLLLGRGVEGIQGQFQDIRSFVEGGPGLQDFQAGIAEQRSLAALLGREKATGGLPSREDIGRAQGITGQLFAPQQLALQQAFEQQRTRSAQEAVRLGRPVTDPVLQNLLAQGQGRQTALLGAQQGAATQQLALQLPGQRINIAAQRAQLLSGLGQQALQNRQSLLGLGSGLLGAERQFRLGAAGQTTTSGGGLGGAIAGTLGGIGAGLKAAGTFGDLFGGLGGGGSGSLGVAQQIPGAKTFPSAPGAGGVGFGGGDIFSGFTPFG